LAGISRARSGGGREAAVSRGCGTSVLLERSAGVAPAILHLPMPFTCRCDRPLRVRSWAR